MCNCLVKIKGPPLQLGLHRFGDCGHVSHCIQVNPPLQHNNNHQQLLTLRELLIIANVVEKVMALIAFVALVKPFRGN